MPPKTTREQLDENEAREREARIASLELRVQVFGEIVIALGKVPDLTEMETVDEDMDPRERVLRAVAALLGFNWPSPDELRDASLD